MEVNMRINQLGSRSFALTFEDDMSIFLILGDKYSLICDTHLGPESMEEVKAYLTALGRNKEIILFNSHTDWDHVWGNCAFPDAKIIAHTTARTRLQEIGEYELKEHKEFHKGVISLKLPNLTFTDKLSLEEENIHFIYAPGHTVDSSICFDERDSCLFVGDLVEKPIPYLDYFDLETYIRTLEFIKSFPAKTLLSSHSYLVDKALIEDNIAYIEGVLHNKPVELELDEYYGKVHQYNLNKRLLFQKGLK